MSIVTISRKFQIRIPREIRESLELRPGQALQAMAFDGRLSLVPVRSAQSLRGFLKGIDTRVPRGR